MYLQQLTYSAQPIELNPFDPPIIVQDSQSCLFQNENKANPYQDYLTYPK